MKHPHVRKSGGPAVRKSARPKTLPLVGAVLTAALALALTGCGTATGDGDGVLARYPVKKGPLRITVTESGAMKSAKPSFITAKSNGKITFLAPEGEKVTKGTLLMSLQNQDLVDHHEGIKRELVTARAALETARAEVKLEDLEATKKLEDAERELVFARMSLDQYRDGKAPLLEQDARLAVERAETERDISREKAERMPALLDKGFVNAAELRTARLDAKEKEQALAKKARELEVFLKYDKPQDLAKKVSDVKTAEITLERTRQEVTAKRRKLDVEIAKQEEEIVSCTRKAKTADEEVAGLELKAPADGILVYFKRPYYWGEVMEVGSEIRKEQRVMELPDLTDMVAEIGINEIVVAKVAIGQIATVTLEGLGGRSFQGRVDKLATTSSNDNPWSDNSQNFKATVVLTDSAGTSFRPGMSARAEITVAELKDVISVPVNAVTHRGDKRWCWVETGGSREKRIVDIGQSNNDRVEIKTGLTEGETVLALASEPTDGARP